MSAQPEYSPFPTSVTSIHLPLGRTADGPSSEHIAALHEGDDHYRILDIPYWSAVCGLDDLVLAKEVSGGLEFVKVIERETRVRFSANLLGPIPERSIDGVMLRAGAAWDTAPCGCIVVNLPADGDAKRLERFFERNAKSYSRSDDGHAVMLR